MEEWEEYTVQELIDKGMLAVPMDGNHGEKHPKTGDYVPTGIPFIMANNLIGGTVDYRNCAFISENQANSLDKGFAKPGDVLITHKATIGRTAIVPDKYDLIVLTPQVTYYRPIKGIDNRFLKYYFDTAQFQNIFKNWAGAGSTRAYLGITAQRKLPVILPDIGIQKRISSILKTLDDKIEVNRRINENLEQQAQALFKSWFVDFEPFRDGEFVESELGMIPKGWRVGCLDELCCFISRGLTPKYDETSDELILGQTCVRNNIVTLNNARKHRPKTKNDKWVQQWDVLLNSTGVGSLGRVGIVYFNMDNVAIDSHITVVRTSSPVYRHYVGRNLLGRQLEIENMAVGSTGQTELPRDRVKVMPIIIPSDDIMDKFNAIIEPMAISMYSNITESRRLATLRDTLLPKLMSGELKVNDVD